jgi:hypothetical protein
MPLLPLEQIAIHILREEENQNQRSAGRCYNGLICANALDSVPHRLRTQIHIAAG